MQRKKRVNFGKIVLIVVGGMLVGVANGLFGGGGGMLCVPLLLAMRLENQKAQATAILIMTPISIASAVVYYTSGYIEWWNAIHVGIGSIIGGILGASLLKKFSNISLQYIFAIIMLIAGLKMIF